MDLALQYDGLGRLTNAADAIGQTQFTYTPAGELASEDGPWAHDTITYGYQYRRRTTASLEQTSGTWTQSYWYDGYGRLTNVSSAAGDFGYRYDAQRATRITQLSLPNGHYITNQFDALARLTQSTLVSAAGTVRNAHGYQLNLGHQRTNQVFTNATLALAGQRLGYTYDQIGQLKKAEGTQTNGTAWGTNQWGYAYDPAWNLNTRTNNGTVEAFLVDVVNQLTNTANPVAFGYDWNGNLRTNGTQVLEYDYENQLTSVEVPSSWRSEFQYDFQGRLRIRKEYTWGAGGWNPQSETRYVYDGMLVVQERNGSDIPQVSYTRGQDLGGGLQSAGGIGGLLARTQHGEADEHGYYHSDGNGNVTAILAPDGDSLLAAYLYDPYGRTLQSSGTWASANVYRFSSKEWHANAALYYYGYRMMNT